MENEDLLHEPLREENSNIAIESIISIGDSKVDNMDEKVKKEDIQKDYQIKKVIMKHVTKKNEIYNQMNIQLTELRNQFQRSLAKLHSNETKQIGIQELQSIIFQNRDPNSLRIFISLLSDSYRTSSPTSREYLVTLCGYLAEIFQDNLIDPLDKPPSIIKTVLRLVEIVIKFLNSIGNSAIIHQTSSLALVKLYRYSMPKDNPSTIILIFYEPFAALISGGTSKIAQIGASICLRYLMFEFSDEILCSLFLKFTILFLVYFIRKRNVILLIY